MARTRKRRRTEKARRRVGVPPSLIAQATPLPDAESSPPVPGKAQRLWTLVPASLLAILGLIGVFVTIRVTPPLPPARDPIRFVAGRPLAERMLIILAPQLDADAALELRAALGNNAVTPVSSLLIDRPDFASFDEATLQLLAGNVASGGTAPQLVMDTAGQPPDTVVRGVISQGRGGLLIGPKNWQLLFGLGGQALPASSPGPTPTNTALLDETINALADRRNALIIVQLPGLTEQGLQHEMTLRNTLAVVGGALSGRDALLVIAGGTGQDLQLTFSGAGSRVSAQRRLDPNDFAPLCAVVLGAPYPFETRGRIAWSVVAGDDQEKAETTASLARQRTNLVANALPFGVPYPVELLTAQAQHPVIDRAIQEQQYAYGYQLAASVVDQADRLLATVSNTPGLPVPRRAAPWLVGTAVAIACYALLFALLGRYWGSIAAAITGGMVGFAVWLGAAYLLQQSIIPGFLSIIVLLLVQAAIGSGCAVWLAHLFGRLGSGPVGSQDQRAWRTVELLVLLAAIPIAVAAYRYGAPWRLRLEETAPLFRWRSALLAPVSLLVVGYGWLWLGQQLPIRMILRKR